MNISIIQPTKNKFIASIGAFLCISTLSAVSMQTPTHALSLDPVVTVTAVATPVPNTTTITPLLMNVQVPLLLMPLPTALAPTIIAAPINTTVPVMITPPIYTPTAPPSTAVNAAAQPKKDTQTPTRTRTTIPIESFTVVPIATSPVVFVSSLGEAQIPIGLSTLDKQGELLQAPAHVSSPALMYTTHQINPKLANLLFSLGVAGVLAGGCVIFATRPSMRTSA